ncbi:MAG: GPR endopeptidase [Clostridia bacterium]|nr:GPR endopeptidase [Clostridia bacterium]
MVESNFVRTDLAAEATSELNMDRLKGVHFQKKEVCGIPVSDMTITTEEGSTLIGKPVGRYVTLECGKVWLCDDSYRDGLVSAISEYILKLVPGQKNKVLVVGLGNRDITPDSLGPKTLDGLIVTRHIREYDKGLFESMGQEEVAAVAPGVVGQTGIETLELIRGAVERVKPHLVIAVDALAARSVDRLCTTVQLTDTGIAPGSGIGNRRREINKESIGAPVIAIGVPTVVDSSTLVYDALSKAGIEDVNDPLRQVLENGRSFFVSLKESDVAVTQSAKIISDALNMAFSAD